MNRLEQLLCILGEECAEVAQRCSKAQRFGVDQKQAGQGETNAERISAELQDLYAAVEMLRDEMGGYPLNRFGIPNDEAIARKRAKVESYMRASPAEIRRLDSENERLD